MAREVRIGLALGGGVARGMAHIGVLQVLAEHGIPVHLVSGTSAGSLVGAMYSAGLDPWTLAQAATQMNWRNLVKLRLRREGLVDGEGLEQFMLRHIGDRQFADLQTPFAAVATDLLTGEEVALVRGRVALAVRASCAFPGIFMPVRMDGRLLVDGGLTNNVPTSVARQMGADVVIAIELTPQRRRAQAPRNLLQIIMQSLAVLQRPQVLQCLQLADVVIRPDLAGFGLVELEKVSELIAAGRRAAEEALPYIRAAVAEKTQEVREGAGRRLSASR